MCDLSSCHNADCKNEMHQKHLCYLMYEGKHYKNPAEYKELVAEGNFICQNCGRTAKDQGSLCVAVKLD